MHTPQFALTEPFDAIAWTMAQGYPFPLPVVAQSETHVFLKLPGYAKAVAVARTRFVEPEFVRVPAVEKNHRSRS